jgi:SagB-type dehydrogenase family enzyme
MPTSEVTMTDLTVTEPTGPAVTGQDARPEPAPATREYLRAMVNRSRAPIIPDGFEPDWADMPRHWKHYPGIAHIELGRRSGSPAEAGASLGVVLDIAGEPTRSFDLAAVADMLHDSYALLARRLAVHANGRPEAQARWTTAHWGRGTASGGGLHPVTIYWIAGAAGPLPPAVYFYSPPRHGLQPLLAGDYAARVRAALPAGADGADASQFLLLGLKFWQSSFKYNNFAYHSTTMDIGTVLASWRLSAAASGRVVRPSFWFDDADLSALLGLDGNGERLFAVVPLPWQDHPATTEGGAQLDASAAVRIREQERSRRVLTFPMLAAALRAAVSEQSAVPPEQASRRAVTDWPAVTGAAPDGGFELPRAAAAWPRHGRRLRLPPPAATPVGSRDAVRTRQSDFGRFSASPVMTAGQLSRLLTAALAGGTLQCGARPARLSTMYVFANHVAGIAPGAYWFDDGRIQADGSAPDEGELVEIKPGQHGAFLQWTYSLSNYNLEQAAAVIVPVVRSASLIEAAGPRGYWLANAAAGAAAQYIYIAASGLGLGCGAVLGFDAVSYSELLGLDEEHGTPLLAVMAGRERTGTASFRYELT